jgi:hypothetical protein
VVGLPGVVVFLATGQDMDRVHDRLRGMGDARRLLFRSTHSYLLLASLLNLALGLYRTPTPASWRTVCQVLGSGLVLAAPFLALAGVCTEPWLSDRERPYSRPAAFACLAGVLPSLLARPARG